MDLEEPQMETGMSNVRKAVPLRDVTVLPGSASASTSASMASSATSSYPGFLSPPGGGSREADPEPFSRKNSTTSSPERLGGDQFCDNSGFSPDADAALSLAGLSGGGGQGSAPQRKRLRSFNSDFEAEAKKRLHKMPSTMSLGIPFSPMPSPTVEVSQPPTEAAVTTLTGALNVSGLPFQVQQCAFEVLGEMKRSAADVNVLRAISLTAQKVYEVMKQSPGSSAILSPPLFNVQRKNSSQGTQIQPNTSKPVHPLSERLRKYVSSSLLQQSTMQQQQQKQQQDPNSPFQPLLNGFSSRMFRRHSSSNLGSDFSETGAASTLEKALLLQTLLGSPKAPAMESSSVPGDSPNAIGSSSTPLMEPSFSLNNKDPLPPQNELDDKPMGSLAEYPVPQVKLEDDAKSYRGSCEHSRPIIKWTKHQDESLRAAVEKYGEKNWKKIAAEVPYRDHVQCLQRWKKVLRPGLVKGPWTKEEDEKLLEIINLHDGDIEMLNWTQLAQQIQGRSPKQCRERWYLNLDPSINRQPWTKDEDQLLLRLHASMGSKWSEIKTQFNGRTENSVKTRFKSLSRAARKKWNPEEDAKLMKLCRTSGKDWDKIQTEFPRRSKNALKNRQRYLANLPKGEIPEELTPNTNSSSSSSK